MTPALVTSPRRPSEGLSRSAALMRALGTQGNAIWSSLTDREARQLTEAMDALPPANAREAAALETEASQSLINELSSRQSPARASVWAELSQLEGAQIAGLTSRESPQIVAVILSHLSAEAAAGAVRALPKALATEALRRMLNLSAINPVALQTIEAQLKQKIGAEKVTGGSTGHKRVARIFDNLSDQVESGLLSELERAEPGAGKRIRALMFTFDDLATLGPASVQTLLSHTGRSTLITALKNAKPETAETFLKNMTARARDLLASEIEAAGPMRRSDIIAARQQMTDLARTLASRGDILTAGTDDDELVE